MRRFGGLAYLAALVFVAGCDGAPLSVDAGPVSPVTSHYEDATLTAGLAAPQTIRADDWVGGDCGQSELMTGGAAIEDVNRDGLLDIFLARLNLPDQLMIAQGDGTYVDEAVERGVDWSGGSNGAAFADVDRDGDLDLAVTVLGSEATRLYIQGPGGGFTEEGVARGFAIDPGSGCNQLFSVAFADVDADGDLDLQALQWSILSLIPPHTTRSRLFENDGSGHFVDVTDAAGVNLDASAAFTSAFADMNDDGVPDMIVAGDFMTSRFFVGQGDGSFVDATISSGFGVDENGMGLAVGDLDGDLDLDILVTSIFDPSPFCDPSFGWDCSGNRVYMNDGNATFTDATDTYGLRDGGWAWGAAFFDYDLDGDLDVGWTNGFRVPAFVPGWSPFYEALGVFDRDPTTLRRNDGAGQMVDVSDVLGVVDDADGRAFIPFDAERDGDLDILVIRNVQGPLLLRNALRGPHHLTVRCEGQMSAPDGRGAVVDLIKTEGDLPLRRLIPAGGSFLGQRPAEANFGLGDHRGPIHELIIRWPSGIVQRLFDVEPDRVLTIVEG